MARASRLPDRIVRAAIHPAIGIARVGNSPDAVLPRSRGTDPLPDPPGFYRDAGALKRQAARFRVYGLDAAGPVGRRADRRRMPRSAGPSTSPTRRPPGTSSSSPWTSPRRRPRRRSCCATSGERPRAARDRSRAAHDRRPQPATAAGAHLRYRQVHGHAGLSRRAAHRRGGPADRARRTRQVRLATGRRAITFANNEGWHDDVVGRPGHRQVTSAAARCRSIRPGSSSRRPTTRRMQKSVRTMWDLMRDVAIGPAC